MGKQIIRCDAGKKADNQSNKKISFVLLIAVLLRERTDIKRVLLSAVIAAVHGIILVASRDLGAAPLVLGLFLLVLFFLF